MLEGLGILLGTLDGRGKKRRTLVAEQRHGRSVDHMQPTQNVPTTNTIPFIKHAQSVNNHIYERDSDDTGYKSATNSGTAQHGI